MKEINIHRILQNLLQLPAETECVEFKKAERDYDFRKLGKYFSALSNEANLREKSSAWLVFGIDDKTRKIVGSHYREEAGLLDELKKGIADQTTGRITFKDIYELKIPEGRVVIFEVPAAPQGVPIAWAGHYYGRDGTSLEALNLEKIERIRRQTHPDWSAQICHGACIDDLSIEAIKKARIEYKIKHPSQAEAVDKWEDVIFLNKARITIDGQITRTAILLLGKLEAVHFISPAVAKISWILKDDKNMEKDYEHFGPPFILNTDAALAKIRNLRYRYMPDNTLFPIEITQYEAYVIREALHNCIAHQDYEKCSRITLVERSDELIFSNAGNFIPGRVESVIENDSPQKYYRNRFLSEAMTNLNMIDTIGGGIKKMFIKQRERFFPMPTYNLEEPEEVTVIIPGRIIDDNYTRLLLKNPKLDLATIILLDKVQKKEKLTKTEIKRLKKTRLVEGRYPNLFVASEIATTVEKKATYIKNRALDKEHYKKLTISFISKFGSASRKEINELLSDKLSDALSAQQKNKKIGNLLYEMKQNDKTIKNVGLKKMPKWILT